MKKNIYANMPLTGDLADGENRASRSLTHLPTVTVTDTDPFGSPLSPRRDTFLDTRETQSQPCSPRCRRRAFTTWVGGTQYIIGKLSHDCHMTKNVTSLSHHCNVERLRTGWRARLLWLLSCKCISIHTPCSEVGGGGEGGEREVHRCSSLEI